MRKSLCLRCSFICLLFTPIVWKLHPYPQRIFILVPHILFDWQSGFLFSAEPLWPCAADIRTVTSSSQFFLCAPPPCLNLKSLLYVINQLKFRWLNINPCRNDPLTRLDVMKTFHHMTLMSSRSSGRSTFLLSLRFILFFKPNYWPLHSYQHLWTGSTGRLPVPVQHLICITRHEVMRP